MVLKMPRLWFWSHYGPFTTEMILVGPLTVRIFCDSIVSVHFVHHPCPCSNDLSNRHSVNTNGNDSFVRWFWLWIKICLRLLSELRFYYLHDTFSEYKCWNRKYYLYVLSHYTFLGVTTSIILITGIWNHRNLPKRPPEYVDL